MLVAAAETGRRGSAILPHDIGNPLADDSMTAKRRSIKAIASNWRQRLEPPATHTRPHDAPTDRRDQVRRRRKLVIASDSVATERSESNEIVSGWGQHLDDLVGASLEVVNTASDSCTTHWYFRNRLPMILNSLTDGDIFLVGFGVCEQAMVRPDLYRTPEEFKAYLGLYIDVLQARGVIPVLVTQAARHIFDAGGSLQPVANDYSVYTRAVAAERGVALIDLQRKSAELFSELGAEKARGYFRWFDVGEHPQCPEGIIDTLHLNQRGARAVAWLVAQDLSNLGLAPGGIPDAGPVPVEPWTRPARIEDCVAQWPDWSQSPVAFTAPDIYSPTEDATGHPTLKFRGNASPGVSWVLFLEGDEVIGTARVGADGRWIWRRQVCWSAGQHEVGVVAISNRGRSKTAHVRFSVRSRVPSPVVTVPKPGSLNGPGAVFRGTAASGVQTVVALCEGRWIGEAQVAADGTWRYRLPHEWLPGVHSIAFVAAGEGGTSQATVLPFEVLTIPPDNWLRQDPVSWQHCAPGAPCAHMRRLRPEGARNILE
ncbi:hypothetical protein ACMATS_37410 [Streptoverticillium reticulum]|uniref:hypothetical protein n=1 Tax=Streptoverticillium reticulum TaxID=1433415 RepID=UPI0039BEF7AA